jgi:hypothetical protein
MTRTSIKTHFRSNKARKKEDVNMKEGNCTILVDTELPPGSSKRVKLVVPWKDEMKEGLIEPGGRLSINKEVEVLDGLFLRNQDSIIISNKGDKSITLKKGDRIATLHSTAILDKKANKRALRELGPLVCLIKTYTRKRSLEKLDGPKIKEKLESELGPNIVGTYWNDLIHTNPQHLFHAFPHVSNTFCLTPLLMSSSFWNVPSFTVYKDWTLDSDSALDLVTLPLAIQSSPTYSLRIPFGQHLRPLLNRLPFLNPFTHHNS